MRALLRRLAWMALLVCSAVYAANPASTEEPVRIFAAASLTNALNDIAARWQHAGHPQPSLAFGASSALAKQVGAGAPADVFASADLKWMDYLDQRGRIAHATRTNLLGNTLVLIAPKGKRFAVKMQRGFDLAGAFKGKLCTGEPGVVPVGVYAKQSLEYLGWWQPLQGRIVGTDDVRTALAFVERGECGAGIVYATDAGISDKVDVLAEFPANTHAPIVYPFAAVKHARPQARAFLQYLRAPEAAAIFQRHGFTVLQATPFPAKRGKAGRGAAAPAEPTSVPPPQPSPALRGRE
jgi:molybdate transport system substrate-binding protein